MAFFINMNLTEFIIIALGVWRLSSLLVEEDGPYNVLEKLRERAGVRSDEDGYAYGLTELGWVLSCLWCTMLWIGLAWFVFWLAAPSLAFKVAIPLALTAPGILIHGRGIRYRKH